MLQLSAETEALVRAEALRLGKSEDEVIRAALSGEVRAIAEQHAEDRVRRIAEMRRRVDAIVERHKALPVLDPRSPDEILGYDENGLFK